MEGTGKSGGQSNGGATSSVGTDRREPLTLRLIVISSPVPTLVRRLGDSHFVPAHARRRARSLGLMPP
jgi:hypothetical protein